MQPGDCARTQCPGIVERAAARLAMLGSRFGPRHRGAAPRVRRFFRPAAAIPAVAGHGAARWTKAQDRLHLGQLPAPCPGEVLRAAAALARSQPVRSPLLLQWPGRRRHHAADPRPRGALRVGLGHARWPLRRADPPRQHRHPGRPRRPHAEQPAGRLLPPAGPGPGHLARLSFHHGGWRNRLPAHRRVRRPAWHDRGASHRGAVALA